MAAKAEADGVETVFNSPAFALMCSIMSFSEPSYQYQLSNQP